MGKGDGSPHARGQREGVFQSTVSANQGGWVPACARTTGGGRATTRVAPTGDDWGWWSSNPFVSMGGRFPNRPYGRECCRVRGSPPSPVFTRAGSNLPPSRGKGFVGVERAIFLVMTCGWPRCLRVARGHGKGGWVPACARTTGGGEVCTPILTFPHQGGREGNREGDGSPHPRGQREGEGANEGRGVTEPSLRIGS